MHQGALWTAVLLTPLLSGCVGGSVEYTQAGIADLRTVSIQMEGVSHTWPPEAPDGQGIALNALLALYPAEPEEDATPLPRAEADIADHESVQLTLVEDQGTVLVERENETGRDLRTIHFLFENGTDDAADPEILVCGEEICMPWTTPESFDDLRMQAEQGAEAVEQG